MNLLSLEQAQKSYGEKVLLKQANFYLNEGEKVGIIGINGTGKTTLLRILAGTEVPDEGSRTVANHVVLRFLEQNPQMPADMSVLEYVLQGEKEEDRLNGGETRRHSQHCQHFRLIHRRHGPAVAGHRPRMSHVPTQQRRQIIDMMVCRKDPSCHGSLTSFPG